MEGLQIIRANSAEQLRWVQELCREYLVFLNADLSYQNFEQEMAQLPGYYAPPTGALLLATYDSNPAGCVALRRITPEICEMKRLFVRTKYRHYGIGKALAQEIIHEAIRSGYRKMRLDSLASLCDAVRLYRKLGFYEIGPYCHNPLPGAVFMELELVSQEESGVRSQNSEFRC